MLKYIVIIYYMKELYNIYIKIVLLPLHSKDVEK